MRAPKEIISAAEVLVGIASLAAVPGAATADTIVTIGSGLWDFYSGRRRTPELVDRVALALTNALNNPSITHVHDTRVLLPQMAVVAMPEPRELAQAGWNAKAVAKAMRQRVQTAATDWEHKTPAMLGAFERWIVAGLRPLMDDPGFVRDSAPVIVRQMFDRFDTLEGQNSELKAILYELLRRTDGFEDAIAHAEGLTLEELRALAAAFGGIDIDGKTELLAYLHAQAKAFEKIPKRTTASQLKQLSSVSSNRILAVGDWSVFKEDNPFESWAATTPAHTAVTRDGSLVGMDRDQVLLMVFFRLNTVSFGSAAYNAGYDFPPGTKISLTASGIPFELFTSGSGSWAWPRKPVDDIRLIDTMRNASEVDITSNAPCGTKTHDVFSLSGFNQAVDFSRNVAVSAVHSLYKSP